jgi:tRNA1(Val) A37 N6-methylase TrmN6
MTTGTADACGGPQQATQWTDDALTGDFRVWQRRRGHRYSLDDVVTADEAAHAGGGARRVLDLGCGIGSVLLMVAWRVPRAELVGVEAQPESFELAWRNVQRNAVHGRVTLHAGDLRDGPWLDALARAPFDLVTGTPPYFPPGTATPSPDPQRAHARLELRGGIEDYLRAARRVMAPGGRVVVCASAQQPGRVTHTAAEIGLSPLRRRDVVPRAGHKGALFTVWTLGPCEAGQPGEGPERAPDFIARDAQGARTETYRRLRRAFGLPETEGEPPSP